MHEQAINVLLMEDNPGDARLVAEMIRDVPGVSMSLVDRLTLGLERLAAQKVDVILLDLGLPDSQGLDTMRAVLEAAADMPVVALTGNDDETLGQAAIREGAQDYLVKGQVRDNALTRAIRYAIERNETRAKLLDSERRFSALFDANPAGLLLVERTSRTVVQANAAAIRLIGLPREKILGRLRHEFICLASQDACLVLDAGHEVDRSEQVLVTGGGDHIPILKTVVPIGAGGNDFLLESFMDIRDRREAEEALLRSERTARERAEELQALMDMIPIAVWVAHDPDCRVITGNLMAGRFYEADPEDNVSAGPARGGEQDTTRRFFRDGRELLPEELPMQMAVITGKEVATSELTVQRPSGTDLTMLGSAAPLFDAHGRIRGCIGAFMDITERRHADEVLRKQAAELASQNRDLAFFNQVVVGRELRMIELKGEVNELCLKLGESCRYKVVED